MTTYQSARSRIEATRQLAGPDVDDPLAVVVVTTFDLDEYVWRVEGRSPRFLLKDASPDLLNPAHQDQHRQDPSPV